MVLKKVQFALLGNKEGRSFRVNTLQLCQTCTLKHFCLPGYHSVFGSFNSDSIISNEEVPPLIFPRLLSVVAGFALGIVIEGLRPCCEEAVLNRLYLCGALSL